MKTLDRRLSDITVSDIQQVARCIRDFSDPSMIIYYEDPETRNSYRFFVLFKGGNPADSDQIISYVDEHYRLAKPCQIYLMNDGFFSSQIPQSYYLYCVATDGYVLYSDKRISLNPVLRKSGFTISRHNYHRCRAMADAFLFQVGTLLGSIKDGTVSQTACFNVDTIRKRMLAVGMYSALDQLRYAVCWAFIGFNVVKGLEPFALHYICNASETLGFLYADEKRFCNRLQQLYRHAKHGENFNVSLNELELSLKEIRKIGRIIGQVCDTRFEFYKSLPD